MMILITIRVLLKWFAVKICIILRLRLLERLQKRKKMNLKIFAESIQEYAGFMEIKSMTEEFMEQTAILYGLLKK